MRQKDFDTNKEKKDEFSVEKSFKVEKEDLNVKRGLSLPALGALIVVMFGLVYFLALKTGIIAKVRSTDSDNISTTASTNFSAVVTTIPETTTILETTTVLETTTEKVLQTKDEPSNSVDKPLNLNDTENVISFYKNAVFVGDSLMDGFDMYISYAGGNCLGRPQFLAATSFSLYNALRPVSDSSIHPMYKGQDRLVEDSISMMKNVDKVFMFFGANDVGYGVDYSIKNYKTLIDRIHRKSPEKKIYIISAMYMVKASEKEGITNKNLAAFNEKMFHYCQQMNYGYIDIADHLGDKENGIIMKYSSDNYVHVNISGYRIWASVLRDYAENSVNPNYSRDKSTGANETGVNIY